MIQEDEWLPESDEQPSENQIPASYQPHLKNLLIFIFFWQFAFTISNAAITCLLQFLRYIFLSFCHAFQCEPMVSVGKAIPLTLKSVYGAISHSHFDNKFVSYVVCPTCDSIYEFDDCIKVMANGHHETKHCKHICFPKHPHRSRRNECGTLLLKKVRTKNGYKL